MEFYSYDSIHNPWCAGGGAYRDFEVLKRQRKQGQDIYLYVGAYPGFISTDLEGIKIRALGWKVNSYLLSRLSFTLSANLKVLFSNASVMGYTISIFAPILTGLLRPNRFYMVFHHFVGKQSFQKLGPVGLIAYFSEWLLFRYGRNIIVINRVVEARVLALNPKANLLLSGNGFASDLLGVTPVELQPAFILFLGRFDVYMKGIDILIEAFRRFRQNHLGGKLRLVLAGRASAEALAEVQALCNSGISQISEDSPFDTGIDLKVNISLEEKSHLLSGCLFFCSPSRFEGFGIAALEASAAGKALLVTETDGFRESVVPDKTGLMGPVGDVDFLVRGMQRLVDDAVLRQSLGTAGREWARGFTWDGVAAREGNWISESMPRQGK
jgi:glycosyltransferase involved in cell wall biosynthesis